VSEHPIDNIVWRPAVELRANAWNPNYVLEPELRLLERSILQTGWVQPLLVTPLATIIDGYHRYRLALESEALRARDHGLVPCVTMPVSEPQAMILTVRMNRAKGVHAAFRMSALVRALIDEHGYPRGQVAAELGMEANEVDLLHQEGVFEAKRIAEYRYSKAWVPGEDGRKGGQPHRRRIKTPEEP
jgi:ParB-like chromosome segregation protein Spo0J